RNSIPPARGGAVWTHAICRRAIRPTGADFQSRKRRTPHRFSNYKGNDSRPPARRGSALARPTRITRRGADGGPVKFDLGTHVEQTPPPPQPKPEPEWTRPHILSPLVEAWKGTAVVLII